MSYRNSNKTRQPQLNRPALIASSSLFFLLAIMLVNVYPGNPDYDWKSHVRVEESFHKADAGSLSAEIQELKKRKKELLMIKVREDSENMKKLSHTLELQESLKDLKDKLRVGPKLSRKEKEVLNQRLNVIKKEIDALTRENYE